jgi:hypothetical protein
MNKLDKSFVKDQHECCGTIIQVHAQLDIPLKSSFTSGEKL